MKKPHGLYLSLLFLSLLLPAVKTQAEATPLLDRLDKSLAHKDEYEKLRISRIDRLKKLAEETSDTNIRYEILTNIYNEYKSYSFDSSAVYGYKCLDIAMQTGKTDDIAQAKCNIAFAYLSAGISVEALDLLKGINPAALSGKTIASYYYVMSKFWQEEADKSPDKTIHGKYMNRSNAYLDSLLSVTAVNSPKYWRYSGLRHLRRNESGEAIKCYTGFLKHDNLDIHDKAMVYVEIAWAYDHLGNEEKALENFILSAICDNESATREITALYWVGRKIMQRGAGTAKSR